GTFHALALTGGDERHRVTESWPFVHYHARADLFRQLLEGTPQRDVTTLSRSVVGYVRAHTHPIVRNYLGAHSPFEDFDAAALRFARGMLAPVDVRPLRDELLQDLVAVTAAAGRLELTPSESELDTARGRLARDPTSRAALQDFLNAVSRVLA